MKLKDRRMKTPSSSVSFRVLFSIVGIVGALLALPAPTRAQGETRVVKNLKRIEKAWFPVSQFLPQLVSETSRACTIRVRQSSLGRPWNAWGAPARLCHRNSESRTAAAKRISDGGERDSARSDQGSVTAFGRRKGDTGRDRSPPASNGAGGRGGHGQARNDSGLVSEAHREQI